MVLSHGSVVIITNQDFSLFYLEKKSNDYQFPQYRGAHSFFGGHEEPEDNSPEETLIRELFEELTEKSAKKVSESARPLVTTIVPSVIPYKLTLAEAILSDRALENLDHHNANGDGLLIERKDILEIPYIWDLKPVMKKYLNSRL